MLWYMLSIHFSIVGSRLCLLDNLTLLLASFVNLEEHGIIGSLIPNKLAFLLMHSCSGAHDHAAAEEYLRQENRYQNIRVLGYIIFITLRFFIFVI